VNGGEVDAQDSVVADEVGADLAGVGVRVGLKPCRRRGAVEALGPDLQQVIRVDGLDMESHLSDPRLNMSRKLVLPLKKECEEQKKRNRIGEENVCALCYRYGSRTCSLFPVGSDVQRSSFMSSQAKMVGSSL